MELSALCKKNEWLHCSKLTKLHRAIYSYVCQFTDDEDLLVASLITTFSSGVRDNIEYNARVGKILEYFRRMQQGEKSLLDNKDKLLHDTKILFLSYYKIILDKPGTLKKGGLVLKRGQIKYLMAILESLNITVFHHDLDDKLFAMLSPKIYKDYVKLRQFSETAYEMNRKDIVKFMKDDFRKAKIKVEIQTRLKTIYSIHTKILRKNTLYSQVLDVMGFRIITSSSEACYRVLSQFLYKWDVISSKVKDYIAVPKDNGYQSIHLTVFYKDFPIEIQIRSKEMDQFAEFGRASHFGYKHGN